MGDVVYLERIRAKLTLLQNVGRWERLARFLAGTALGAYGILIALQGRAVWPTVAVLASMYPVISAMVGWDPLYHVFGVRTCGRHCRQVPFELDDDPAIVVARLAAKTRATGVVSRRSKADD